jgi:acyl-[acyl-carrier-protein]-phospholipid O-acyltransferase/long-chain-fatty-acid--[acyl-carrier-protein] ligase
MGAQSAFFGPLKYGLLPEVLDKDDLVAGNGLVEAATFLAIVLGTLAGSWLVGRPGGTTVFLPGGLVLVAALGLVLALKQPESAEGQSDIKVDLRVWRSTWAIVGSVRGRRAMWLSVLAISWFWAMGGILITQIPVLCRDVLGGTPGVNSFLVTLFALGVGLGSLAAQWLLRGEISARLVPVSAAWLSLFLILMALSVWRLPEAAAGSVTLPVFLGQWAYVRLGLCCLLVSVTGGLFVVPLNALLQHLAGAGERSRVIAANNIVNALFICAGSLSVMILTSLGFSLAHVFAFVAVTAVAVAVLTLYFLPDQSLKTLAAVILKIFFRPKVTGLEHIRDLKEGPALLIANHTSLLDAVLLVAYIPRRLTFAIDSYWAQVWWIKPLLRVFQALPVNPNQPLATRGLIDALNQGELVVVFPEGRITTTGGLMKIYDGSGLIAAKTNAPLLPVVIDGPQYTRFGRLREHMHNLPKKTPIRVTIMPPRRLEIKSAPGEKQKDQRRRAGEALYTLMTECRFQTMDYNRNLWAALKDSARRCGSGRVILEDAERKPLTYAQLMFRARLQGRRFTAFTKPGEQVGVLLPNSVANMTTLLGLWAAGRTAVMMNYSQGPGPMTSALTTAQVKTVITSRRFLANAEMEEMAANLPARMVYLEDLGGVENVSLTENIAARLWRSTPESADGTAIMVFTSGSEGKPKGVALSHRNLLSNVYQSTSLIEVHEDDIFFNALPMFHAFGLTVGVLTPLMSGMRCFTYLSPLHTKIIPELIYDTRATVAIASDTFASAWGRNAHHYDFTSLRIMLVGAEKLKPKTRALYADKLGVRVFEGYGASETAPVLALGGHMNNRVGTVGPMAPGVEYKVEPVEGVAKGGKLVVRGPNVMRGYMRPEQPGVIVPPEDGWYDTGDIVEIDDDGFVWIKGRFKRFAKIGGEMVSLAAVEEVAAAVWPGRPQVVIAMDDDAKGEKLVFITQDPAPDLPRLWQALKEDGKPEIYFPRQFIYLAEVPMTPLGKINHPKVMEAVYATLAK